MARQRTLSPERKVLINQLLAAYNPDDAADVQSMLRNFWVIRYKAY